MKFAKIKDILRKQADTQSRERAYKKRRKISSMRYVFLNGFALARQ